MATHDDLLEGFRFRLRSRGLAASSVRKYEAAASDFLSWLDGRDPVSVRRADVENYLDQWAGHDEETTPAPATVRVRIAALARFYDYLDSRDMLVDEDGRELRNPCDRIERPRSRRKPNDYLSADETQALLAACSTPQERAILDVLRWTGLRISEAVGLTWSDYDGETIRVRESKTDSGLRSVPVLPELRDSLASWRSHLERKGLYDARGPILVTRNRTPLKPQQAWRQVKRVAARAGVRSHDATDATGHNVSDVTCHTLRRTFGTDLLNRGVRIETVSKSLGHSDTRTTTLHYAELQDATARDEILSAYGTAAFS